jgi:hypothetical protein
MDTTEMLTHIVITVAESLTQIITATIIVLIQRWLLELSTIEKDIAWLKRQHWYQRLTRLRFYQGDNVYHQLRAYRLLRDM